MQVFDSNGRLVDDATMRGLRRQALLPLIEARRGEPDAFIAVNASPGWERAAQAVLIHAGAAIGDALLCTPLIRKLAGMGMAVDVAPQERSAAVFEGNPFVRSVFIDASAGGEYDAVIDLLGAAAFAERYPRGMAEGYARSAYLTLEGDTRLDYFVADGERAVAAKRLAGVGGPRCAYVWSAVGSARTWSDAQHARALDLLARAGVSVVVVGAACVDAGPVALNLSGRTTIREAAAVIDAVDFVVAPDTGLFHVAAALDKPTLAYFGSFPLADRRTHDRVYPVARGGCSFEPCRIAVCVQSIDAERSPCLDLDEAAFCAALRKSLR